MRIRRDRPPMPTASAKWPTSVGAAQWRLPMKKFELKVFISNRDSVCDECHEQLGPKAWIFLAGERGALCLDCADLGHLEFLPSGDAALTRRATKHSRISALVLKWSRARNRYERQGVLVEDAGLAQAEQECLADAELRERRRVREELRRSEVDQAYIAQFAARVRELFPNAPAGREKRIAEHACAKYSGRVGRSAAAKRLDDEAVRLAVIAHVRHAETEYDELLGRGVDRFDARGRVAEKGRCGARRVVAEVAGGAIARANVWRPPR